MKIIKLSRGLEALVDDEDYEHLAKNKWYADVGSWTTYAKTDQLPKRPRMHVVIMKPEPGLVVHHKDNNGLNNQRYNMENMTQAAHSRLSKLRHNKTGSKFRGVYWHIQRQRYVAEITVNYKKQYLGLFETETEAALAYNKASAFYFGSGAVVNEIPNDS